MQIAAAHRQNFGAALQMDISRFLRTAHDARDGTKVYDDRSMHLREMRSIELRYQFLQRRPDDSLAQYAARLMPRHHGVLLVGPQKIDILNRNQRDCLPYGCA